MDSLLVERKACLLIHNLQGVHRQLLGISSSLLFQVLLNHTCELLAILGLLQFFSNDELHFFVFLGSKVDQFFPDFRCAEHNNFVALRCLSQIQSGIEVTLALLYDISGPDLGVVFLHVELAHGCLFYFLNRKLCVHSIVLTEEEIFN